MVSMKDAKIRQKILFGFIVMMACCLIVAVIAFVKIGTEGNGIGLVIILINAAAVIFGTFYGIALSNSITEPLKKSQHALEELSLGHLDVKVSSNAQDEIGDISRALDYFIDVFKNNLVGALESIVDGDFAQEFPSRDSRDEISVILNKITYTIRKINDGMGDLISDVSEGNLTTRGDIHQFGGMWSEFIANINKLIEAFVAPINVTSEYVNRISKGDIPPKITDEYKGDFNEIKNSLNNCIDIVNSLLEETNSLIASANDGDLDARGNERNYTGDWKQLMGGMNRLLETVVAPIREVSDVMNELTGGNLEVAVHGHYKGEFKKLSDSVNITMERLHMVVNEISGILMQMSAGNLNIDDITMFDGNFESISISLSKIVESLNTTLGEIHSAAEQVSIGSVQVADGSQLLAQGATEQASSVEQLTAAVTQVAAQTKVNAENANQANSLVTQIKDNAERGNGQMGEMLESMNEINEASANISKVIKVIDDMAFQTKILALNAAVEAARAGQHGKGFAVVAEEVRNLAARSAEAAKETTALIEGSIQRAQRGKEIANDTAKALEQITEGVEEAVNLISGIAVSSNEQATGISQINIGINQVSQVVQTNSATSEESAAASEELSGQADLLKELVEQFKLKGSGMSSMHSIKKEPQDRKIEMRTEYSKPQIILSDSEFGKY